MIGSHVNVSFAKRANSKILKFGFYVSQVLDGAWKMEQKLTLGLHNSVSSSAYQMQDSVSYLALHS